jgi:ribosomal protein L30E
MHNVNQFTVLAGLQTAKHLIITGGVSLIFVASNMPARAVKLLAVC